MERLAMTFSIWLKTRPLLLLGKCSHFEKSNMTNRAVAWAELNAVWHNSPKDITVYICTMAAAASRLTAIGVTVDATTHKDLFLINLDLFFSAVCTVLLTHATESMLEDYSLPLLLILGSSRMGFHPSLLSPVALPPAVLLLLPPLPP
jgi:hypothetical protein